MKPTDSDDEPRDASDDTVEIVTPQPPPSEDRGPLGVQFLLPEALAEQAGAS